MPATVVVVVIPEVPPAFAADEFGWLISANRTIGGLHTLTVDQAITMTRGVNVTTAGAHRLEAAALEDVSLTLTAGTNTTTGGAHTLAEAPPDGTFLMAAGTNTTTGGAHDLAEAPPDENLLMTAGTNTSTGGTHVIEETEVAADDEDSMIGGGPIGSTPI